MKTTTNTPTFIFAALVPIVLGFTFLLYASNMTSDSSESESTAQWTTQIEDTTFQSTTLERLTFKLYNESQNGQRPVILSTLLLQITDELYSTNADTPQALTDLLRDISLEHKDNMVRRAAYEAMLLSLETESRPFQAESELATN